LSIRITPLTDPHRDLSGHHLAWLASDATGIPLGSAFLRLFTRAGQEHLAQLELNVHPAERRRQVGSRLLASAVAGARDDGRRSVIAETDPGSPGDVFLPARGFRNVLTLIHTRLPMERADLADLADRPHPGYRLVSWEGTVPDALAETFTAARRAMDDMPMGDTDYGTVVWDIDQVRAAALAVEERGDLLYTVVAVDDSDGTVAGFTELVVPGDGTGDGRTYSTGVLPEHRGHGLGRWMKAESIMRTRRHHPGVEGLLTDTADDNPYMRGINDSLGYAPTHTVLLYQLDL
jgi:GNAT superfamily N-acetyltransferase